MIAKIFSNKASKATATVSVPVEKKHSLAIPEDSMLRRHFLTQLRAVVEAEVLPESLDPSLSHYYEASVAAEFQKRLAG